MITETKRIAQNMVSFNFHVLCYSMYNMLNDTPHFVIENYQSRSFRYSDYPKTKTYLIFELS